jgi:hypothetical protein
MELVATKGASAAWAVACWGAGEATARNAARRVAVRRGGYVDRPEQLTIGLYFLDLVSRYTISNPSDLLSMLNGKGSLYDPHR